MKTNPSVRIFKFTGLAFLGIVMALVAQPSRAGAVNSLVITEDSNTSLTVTYNGRRVGRKVNPSPNLWQVYLTASSIRFSEMSVQWTESEDSHLVNFVFFGGGAAFIQVASDVQFFPGPPVIKVFPNGATVDNVGIDTVNGGPVNVTFNDNAGPDGGLTGLTDTGSTIGLLFVSLLALLGATRLRSIRLA